MAYTVLTGAQFNERARNTGTKMFKVLNSDFIHNNYTYKLHALNDLSQLGEQFDPDPNCTPGGLYFCAESDILVWLCTMDGQLIAPVEIPDDAQVSVGDSKFKTDKLYIGQPMSFQDFYSDAYIRSMPQSYISHAYRWHSEPAGSLLNIVARRHYKLNPDAYSLLATLTRVCNSVWGQTGAHNQFLT